MIRKLFFRIIAQLVPDSFFTVRGIKKVSRQYTADTFYFVQIGANDGLLNDPLHYFIKKYGWRGVLVEPVPEYFNQLKETYANHQGLLFENAAVSDYNGEQKIFKVREGAKNIAKWFQTIASFHKNTLLEHKFAFPDIEDHIEEQIVRCIMLEELIQKYGVQKIDLLCIDVQGHEPKILRQLPRLHIRPAVIFYEHKHLSKEEKRECRKILTALGYALSSSPFKKDTLAYLSQSS